MPGLATIAESGKDRRSLDRVISESEVTELHIPNYKQYPLLRKSRDGKKGWLNTWAKFPPTISYQLDATSLPLGLISVDSILCRHQSPGFLDPSLKYIPT